MNNYTRMLPKAALSTVAGWVPLQGVIAITDHGWYRFLSARPSITEVNFWTPSARTGFRTEPFSPFLFKLKAPHNAVCGFAYFAQYSRLPDWLAWEAFEEGNGCESFEEMRERIREIRSRIRYDETTGSYIPQLPEKTLRNFPA